MNASGEDARKRANKIKMKLGESQVVGTAKEQS